MKKLNREDINTQTYWNVLYDGKERRGWWSNSTKLGSVKTFFSTEIERQLAKGKNKFIDIGGGNGAGAEIVRQEFPKLEVWNLDISSIATIQGKEKYPLVNQICFDLNNNIDKLGLNNKFSIILCQETIEHINNINVGLAQIMKLAQLGCVCCFTFPNNEGYTGGREHIWTFEYNSIPQLFYGYTDEVTVCNFRPFGTNPHLHLMVKFYKTK